MSFADVWRPTHGYISNIPPDGGTLTDFIASGSRNIIVLGPQLISSFPGFSSVSASGSTLNWAYGDSLLSLGANHGAGIGSGNAVLFVGRSIFYVGTGALKYNGTQIGALTADSTLRLTLFNGSSYSTTAFQAGLSEPAAPTLAVTGAASKVSGSRSMVFTKVRTTTGAESNGSPPSNVVEANQQQLVGTFPLFGTWTDGTNAYNVYVTPEDFGTTGPWLFYRQITSSDLDGSGNYTFQFYDAELTPDQPPIDFDMPPAATHAFSMGNVFVLGGTYSGVGISSSVPNYPEAFPPTSTYFLPEVLVGVVGGPQDGFTFLICKNSVHAAIWTGAPDGPAVIARPFWKDIGFSSINNVAVAGKHLYGFAEKFGIVRTSADGNPDFEFARRIQPDTASWVAANVSVGYSPIQNIVVFAHGSQMLVYHIDLDKWDAPVHATQLTTPFSGSEVAVGFYTQKNALYMTTWDGSTYRTKGWGAGTDGSNYILKTDWRDGGVGPFWKHIERVMLNGKFPNTPVPKIYRNYSTSSSATLTLPSGSTVDKFSGWLKTYVRNARNFQIEITGSGADHAYYSITAIGEEDPILQG
jgi:hypothetical protein